MVTALDNLARIVQDNIAEQMVFLFSSGQDVADALKGKEDQLSKEILAQLGRQVPRPGGWVWHLPPCC